MHVIWRQRIYETQTNKPAEVFLKSSISSVLASNATKESNSASPPPPPHRVLVIPRRHDLTRFSGTNIVLDDDGDDGADVDALISRNFMATETNSFTSSSSPRSSSPSLEQSI